MAGGPSGATQGFAGPPNPPTRFRSFAERYVIERATHFEAGKELEGAWKALQDAKKIYAMIAEGDVEAQRAGGDAGNPAPPPATTLFQGKPLRDVLEQMKEAGMSPQQIHNFLFKHVKGFSNGTP